MKTYIVPWNPTKVDEINHRLPEILSDVWLELEPTKFKMKSAIGGEDFEINGAPMVKIIVDVDDKDSFVVKLKGGNDIGENFPHQLRAFIAENLQINVF